MSFRNVHQQKTVISIPREEFLENIVLNKNLNKKDLRVALFLLTELDGYTEPCSGSSSDPKNFKTVKAKKIAQILDISSMEVRESLKKLTNDMIIEKGNSNSSDGGYRFRF